MAEKTEIPNSMDEGKTRSAHSGVSRREAIKLGGALGFGTLGIGLFGCGTGGSKSESWDETVDVVVVGSGSGAYTALRTQHAGLSTIVLEKRDTSGGATSMSSSVVWAPCNDLMLAEGKKDSKEEALTYIEAGTGDTFMPDLAAAYVDHVNAAVKNCAELAGIKWKIWPSSIDYLSFLPGGKTYGRSLLPDAGEGKSSIGVLSAGILAAAESEGVKFMKGTPCTALVSRTADDGTVEILGCVAKKGSKTIRIRAKKAVVMATGGFDWNQQMMKSYLRTPAQHSWGCSTDTGDGHKMAMRVGADMNMMSEGWLSPGYKKEFDESRAAEASNLSSLIMDDAKRGIIFVNKHGKRFTNECANYDSVGRSFCAIENDGEERGWKNLPAFAIIDQAAADSHTFNKGELGKPGESFTRFETLEELADACGIDKQSLLAEVSRYNENAEMGLDPDFQRGQDYYAQQSTYSSKGFEGAARTLAPLTTPPFYAAEIVPVLLGTMGGIKVDSSARALDTDGKIISRLYAQGNCAGVGAGGSMYVGGGGTIGPAIAFGEIAASDIETLSDWK